MRGSDGAGFEDGALIKAVVDGTPGADDMPTALTISTTADGAATVTERMAIRADGRIQVPNGAAPLITLYPAGHVDLAEVSTPAAPSTNTLRTYALDVGGATKLAVEDSAGSVAVLGPGELIAIIEDNKAQNTVAQTLSSGSDQIRELNTLVYNRNSLVSLSSNQFTLPAGTWEIEWEAPYNPSNGGDCQSLLYNVTDASEVKRGASTGFDDGNAENGYTVILSCGSTVVTIAASKAFEIRHRVSATATGGRAANFGTEVYTRVVVRRA
jgi:hypothetical protein